MEVFFRLYVYITHCEVVIFWDYTHHMPWSGHFSDYTHHTPWSGNFLRLYTSHTMKWQFFETVYITHHEVAIFWDCIHHTPWSSNSCCTSPTQWSNKLPCCLLTGSRTLNGCIQELVSPHQADAAHRVSAHQASWVSGKSLCIPPCIVSGTVRYIPQGLNTTGGGGGSVITLVSSSAV